MSVKAKAAPAAEPANPPAAKIRIGLVTASLWERPTEKGHYYAASFERRYRDKGGEWRTAHTFDAADLLALSKAADLAHTRILELQSGHDE